MPAQRQRLWWQTRPTWTGRRVDREDALIAARRVAVVIGLDRERIARTEVRRNRRGRDREIRTTALRDACDHHAGGAAATARVRDDDGLCRRRHTRGGRWSDLRQRRAEGGEAGGRRDGVNLVRRIDYRPLRE